MEGAAGGCCMCISFVVSLGSCDWGGGRGADVGAPACAALARGDMFPDVYGDCENAAC